MSCRLEKKGRKGKEVIVHCYEMERKFLEGILELGILGRHVGMLRGGGDAS